eukprot:jgi/Mesvir1/17876/Mv12952-RA.1
MVEWSAVVAHGSNAFVMAPIPLVDAATTVMSAEGGEPKGNTAGGNDASTSTDPVQTKSVGMQSLTVANIQVQTDALQMCKLDDGVKVPTDAELLPFIARTAPLMEDALAKNLQSSTSNEEELFLNNDLARTVQCLHTLNPVAPTSGSSNAQAGAQGQANAGASGGAAAPPSPLANLVVTSLSWNCTGFVIAAAYGRNDVDGWCKDTGALLSWNLGRRDMNANKPDVNIPLDNCLMTIAFHPAHPALLAGGTFNGELFIWDLGREEDPRRAVSSISEVSHKEPITQVVWQYDFREAAKYNSLTEAYQVLTISGDGRVLVWNWAKLDCPLYGYEMMGSRPGQSDRRLTWGGTAMALSSVNRDDYGTFVVGTEGGTLYKCFMHHNELMVAEFAQAHTADKDKDAKPKRAFQYRSPIKTEYVAHAGPVHCVDCSPFARNVFVSCGADGSARVYNMLQTKPVLLLEPSACYLFAAKWSPFRPTVLAVAAGDGRAFLYDLHRSTLHPITALNVCDTPRPVYALEFNPRLPEYLATSDGPTIKVWQLGQAFTEQRAAEYRVLDRLADVGEASNEVQAGYSL